jgi:hypothetical protein
MASWLAILVNFVARLAGERAQPAARGAQNGSFCGEF